MARKRRDTIERKEMMKLTKVAKSWEFTCSFCFKQFPSAQAMGGHQNAHRNERLEEKRLFVRDPIGYRKRAFLRAAAKAGGPSAPAVDSGGCGDEYFLNDFDDGNGGDGKGKACIELKINLDQKLDLTLKL